jgi:hypothetical protein
MLACQLHCVCAARDIDGGAEYPAKNCDQFIGLRIGCVQRAGALSEMVEPFGPEFKHDDHLFFLPRLQRHHWRTALRSEENMFVFLAGWGKLQPNKSALSDFPMVGSCKAGTPLTYKLILTQNPIVLQ